MVCEVVAGLAGVEDQIEAAGVVEGELEDAAAAAFDVGTEIVVDAGVHRRRR